ncbi:MAG TPA: Crp/Fnr family transcriptional regulator [Candidatus Acidoferrum sp.]|jgi:CRP-like cAMP-binding protein
MMAATRASAISRYIFSKTELNHVERCETISASALFAGLSQPECVEIASSARARTFARDELLFVQGQPVSRMVLLQAGSVKLTQLSSSGSEALLWMNGVGDAIGMPGTASCSHSCSARAMERCHALTWEYRQVGDLLAEYPRVRQNVNNIVSSRLHELEERFREVSTEKVAPRLALTLLRLVRKIGKQGSDGIDVSLSREELAQMTGSTLFTISRIFSKWAEEGFVLPRRNGVVVLDTVRLQQVGETSD